jgi:hypothetical protein
LLHISPRDLHCRSQTRHRDNNGDTNINDRPEVVNPNGDPLDRATYNSTFSGRSVSLDRNSARGPSFAQLDLRVSKFVRFGNQKLEGFFEPFNISNRGNLGTPGAIALQHRSDERRRYRARDLADATRALRPYHNSARLLFAHDHSSPWSDAGAEWGGYSELARCLQTALKSAIELVGLRVPWP